MKVSHTSDFCSLINTTLPARELLNNLEAMHPDLRKRHQFIDDEAKFTVSVGSAFKEKMETDMQKATDQKESIQQLQGRGTST